MNTKDKHSKYKEPTSGKKRFRTSAAIIFVPITFFFACYFLFPEQSEAFFGISAATYREKVRQAENPRPSGLRDEDRRGAERKSGGDGPRRGDGANAPRRAENRTESALDVSNGEVALETNWTNPEGSKTSPTIKTLSDYIMKDVTANPESAGKPRLSDEEMRVAEQFLTDFE